MTAPDLDAMLTREQCAEWLQVKPALVGRRCDDAPTIPGDPSRVYASMGNYIFSTPTLLGLLKDDAKQQGSHHDFGMDILPKLAGKAPIYAYNFENNRIPGEPEDSVPYWRDVGTIEAFYEANMDLNHVKPELKDRKS